MSRGQFLLGVSTARLDFVSLTSADAEPLREALAWDVPDAPLTGWLPARVDELFRHSLRVGLRRGPTLVGAFFGWPSERTLVVDGFVTPAWRGVGYAVEVLGAIVDHALGGAPSPFDEVRLTVSGGNVAAIRAARAVGFDATPVSGPPRPDGFRGDQVVLTARPELAGRPRVVNDAARVARLIETLGAFHARTLVERNESRAGREYPPLRRHPMALDELAQVLRSGGTDASAARRAIGVGWVDREELLRWARGLGEETLADLQRELRTCHSSASEHADAMSADAFLRRLRKASPR